MRMMFPEGSLFVALWEKKGQKGELQIKINVIFFMLHLTLD